MKILGIDMPFGKRSGITPTIEVPRQAPSPYVEDGFSGTPAWGGFIVSNELNPRAAGLNRYRLAQDIMYNASAVAGGYRAFQNLCSRPKWKITPAKDMPNGKSSKLAEQRADFALSILEDMDVNWDRIVRRMSAYQYNGFGTHELTAKRRKDGMVGLESLKVRPWHTIWRWDLDDSNNVYGVVQRHPSGIADTYLPRSKMVYLVDDRYSDSPEGLGLWRHLVEPWDRMKTYLRLEGQGYERDLRGIPVGRAPLKLIKDMVDAGTMTQEQADAAIAGLSDIVRMRSKSSDTGVVLDSTTYESTTEGGEVVSNQPLWDLKLLTANSTGLADLDKAIDRISFDMLMIIGMETLALGGQSQGSRALSQDKARNVAMNINTCTADLAGGMNHDAIPMLWMLNGWDLATKPTYEVEDASYIDIVSITQGLANLAQAGAPMSPDDPAANEVRLQMGLSNAVTELMTGFEDDPSPQKPATTPSVSTNPRPENKPAPNAPVTRTGVTSKT